MHNGYRTVARFDSVEDASKKLNILKTSVYHALEGRFLVKGCKLKKVSIFQSKLNFDELREK